MDRLDELRLFLAAIEAGSLAAAGRRHGQSPPAMSRMLAGLEERLGVRLLERSTRRLAPTEAVRWRRNSPPARWCGCCARSSRRCCRSRSSYPSARLLPARVRAFLDFAAPRLAALPALRSER